MCCAQKSRRISSNFSRFSPTIASFCRRMSCKKQRRAQQNLQGLCNVHQTILDIFLTQRACVGGRTRAEFQIFRTQNQANFTRKTAQVRRRKCAQRTANARRVNAHALLAFWQTVGTSAQLREALGGCRAPKPRRFSSKFSRFSPKIASFGRSMCCKKHRRARQKAAHLVQHASTDRPHVFDATNLRQCPQLGGFSKIFTQSRAINNFTCKIA